ncbi:MAG: glycosyltransferase [Thermofilum sp.]|nr:glycosyltransferase [Thermofilum sp.]
MNLLVVSAAVGRNPQELAFSFVLDEAIRLAKHGLNVSVARFRFEGDARAYGVSFYDVRRSQLLKLPLRLNRLAHYPVSALLRSPLSLYSELLYSKHIEELIKRLEPDLLHAHFAYLEGWAAYLAKVGLRQRIPLVVTLHGYDILVEPSVGYGIRLSKRYEALVKKVLNAANAIIVASRAVFNEAASLVKDVGKIHLISNGVDTKRFNPALNGNIIRKRFAVEDKQVIFTLRHHSPRYGITYLLLAAKLVLDKRKDVAFIIGGSGPLLDYHKMLTRRLGISSCVFFTGRISQEELPLYYAASDVVVVPSLQEAWGLVATEAMACGKPVVASRVGGLPDQVIDGYNGFLVPPRDSKALADRILYLLENPSEARRMGLNGRRLAEERFDIEKRVDKIVKLYKELVEKSIAI